MANQRKILPLDQADSDIARDIWALFQRAYRIEAEIVGVEDFPPLNRTFEEIQNAESTFSGFFKGSDLTAVAETRIDRKRLSIDGFVVDPKFFRKGFGSGLLRYILEDSNCDTAIVETAAANEPAIRLYKMFGFTEIDRWETADGMELVKLGANLHFNQSIQSDQPSAGC